MDIKRYLKIWKIFKCKTMQNHAKPISSIIYTEMHRSWIATEAVSSAARCQISELSPGDWVEFEAC